MFLLIEFYFSYKKIRLCFVGVHICLLVGYMVFLETLKFYDRMKYSIFFILFIFRVNLLCCQPNLKDYTCFTPERRQVLRAMGEFFDQTIRENFSAETDTLSYKYFGNTLARYTGVNGIDRKSVV